MKAPDNVVVVPTRTERPAIFDPFKSKTTPPIIAIAAKINANTCPRNDRKASVFITVFSSSILWFCCFSSEFISLSAIPGTICSYSRNSLGDGSGEERAIKTSSCVSVNCVVVFLLLAFISERFFFDILSQIGQRQCRHRFVELAYLQ